MWQGIVKSIKICWMEDWYSELCIILNSKKDAYTQCHLVKTNRKILVFRNNTEVFLFCNKHLTRNRKCAAAFAIEC